MSDRQEMCSFKAGFMVRGYEFARDYGGEFPRNELLEEIRYYSRTILRGDDEYVNEVFDLMLEHGMILPAGRKFIWNPTYRAKPSDRWFGYEGLGEGND